ncbi:MAG: rod shape-determining protein MreC [Gammaproteobacteria bacterium]
MGKALFAEEPDSLYRLLVALVAAAVLMFVDVRTGWLKPVRASLSYVTEPVVSASDLPRMLMQGLDGFFTTRTTLADDNARLHQENLLLQRHVQQLAALTAENARLRELLNSSALLDSSVLVAEIVAVDPDPTRAEVVINKGRSDGVHVGQPVLDAHGVFGQVISVGPGQARLLLITDRRHGLPVEINRNGVRAIARGTGAVGDLQLQYLPVTVDIREGDLLVSSGLGGVFPRGYPVGRVTTVDRDPAATFMSVVASPAAAITQSRQVLLVFRQDEPVGAQAGGVTPPPPGGAAGAQP